MSTNLIKQIEIANGDTYDISAEWDNIENKPFIVTASDNSITIGATTITEEQIQALLSLLNIENAEGVEF